MPSPPFLGERAGALDKQICASRPSICRKPFLILVASTEEMLSKASERRDSMAGLECVVWLRVRMGICGTMRAVGYS
jgi:hypothetical protein